MAGAPGCDPAPRTPPGAPWGASRPLLLLFGQGEATLALAAAWIGGGGPIAGPWLLGAWLLAEGGWPALRWLVLEAPWGRAAAPAGPSAALAIPYLRAGSPAEVFLREARRLARAMAACAREVPALGGALATALVALGVGIGLVGWIGGWLTLGAGVALILARRLGRPAVWGLVEGWIFGTLPWWLGLAGGAPSGPAVWVGIPIGLAGAAFRVPAVRWIAWPLWTAWAVAVGHGPGAYGLALIGLLLGEERVFRSPQARRIGWILALVLTVWVLRTLPTF